MAKNNILDWIALILVIIGGLNWGLIGVGVGNIAELVLGQIAILLQIVYILIGLAAIYTIYFAVKK